MGLKPDSDSVPGSKITHLDLNLARLPLIHIRGLKNGPWSFKIDGQNVEGNRRLTRRELAVYVELAAMFEKEKMPEDGSFYTTQNALTRDLIKHGGGTKSKQQNIGGFEKKRLKKYLSNINKTFLAFHGCFEQNGIRQTVMISFPLLEGANLFEREKDDHFFLSQFRFPKTIVENMRAGFWKPIKVAIISHFKSEKALALWMLLDRILSVQEEYNKDLAELCGEIGIVFERERDYAAKMKKVCKDVIRVPLTNGKIIKLCHIAESKTPSGFKVVAIRGENKPVERKAKEPKKIENVEREETILLDWYRELSKNEAEKIDGLIEGISKELSVTFWNTPLSLETAKIEAIRRAYNHDKTAGKILDNANRTHLFKEQPCKNRYFGAPELAQIEAILNPPRPPLLSYFPSLKPASN